MLHPFWKALTPLLSSQGVLLGRPFYLPCIHKNQAETTSPYQDLAKQKPRQEGDHRKQGDRKLDTQDPRCKAKTEKGRQIHRPFKFHSFFQTKWRKIRDNKAISRWLFFSILLKKPQVGQASSQSRMCKSFSIKFESNS